MIQMTCQGLTLGYTSALVRDLDFSVGAGDYLCILGENGTGKSTLLKTLLGLQAPLAGCVTFSPHLRATELGYLPQQTQRDFPATVWEVVLSGCQSRCALRPFYRRAEKDAARQALRRLGIDHLAKGCYRDLSGGQQQRVLLARALCAARKMLLLDEPVAGLDPAASREFYQLIAQLNRQDGMTILMVSHDTQAALADATHVLYLGNPVFFGTREDFLRAAPGPWTRSPKGGEAHGRLD
ncbi:MAG TPA: metal ABC transporter ATP-binding protein [Candidatus Evtepia faecigallinarum]|nr:metal ABC transporter ATP-binding protein [Candidatus Evtepia faecigallinarum]